VLAHTGPRAARINLDPRRRQRLIDRYGLLGESEQSAALIDDQARDPC